MTVSFTTQAGVLPKYVSAHPATHYKIAKRQGL